MAAQSSPIAALAPWALAVLALWVPAPVVRASRAWLWRPALALACLWAWHAGQMDWRALAATAGYAALAALAAGGARAPVRLPALCLTAGAAFLFALHRFPGFANPVLADDLHFSPGALAVTLRANADTAVAGIVLLGTFCARIGTAAAWRAMLERTWPVTLSTLVVVLGLGLALGYVRPDLKWTPYSALFLVVNLLLTCVTEEAFFRGLLLERMRQGLARRRGATAGAAVAATVAAALLFGLAHARGGPVLVVLATLAGLHYGAAYLRSGHVEGAILAHFALNAVHFIAFTYPSLARPT